MIIKKLLKSLFPTPEELREKQLADIPKLEKAQKIIVPHNNGTLTFVEVFMGYDPILVNHGYPVSPMTFNYFTI